MNKIVNRSQMLNTGHGVSVCHRWYEQLKFLLVNQLKYRSTSTGTLQCLFSMDRFLEHS